MFIGLYVALCIAKIVKYNHIKKTKVTEWKNHTNENYYSQKLWFRKYGICDDSINFFSLQALFQRLS